MHNDTKKIALSGVCVAMSLVLGMINLFSLPMGGSVTACSMLFATLPGFFFGGTYGFLSGLAYGALSFILKPYFYSPAQFITDYVLAFTALGLSGLFSQKKHGLFIGYIVACLGRFFFAFLSGVLFFASYAPEGMNPIWYSFSYNISYISVEMVLTLGVLLVPAVHKGLYRMKGQLLSEGSYAR